jgi:hypothetical protein
VRIGAIKISIVYNTFEKVQEIKLRAKLDSHEEISSTRIKFCAAFDF